MKLSITNTTKPEFVPVSVTDLGKKVDNYSVNEATKAYVDCKNAFVEQFKANPRHCLEWNTEEVMKRQEYAAMWQRAAVVVAQEVMEHAAKRAMMDLVTEAAKHVLRFPPYHNSTSEVSNLHTLAENAARCEFVQKMSEFCADFTFVS
jgi:hypothetical protein